MTLSERNIWLDEFFEIVVVLVPIVVTIVKEIRGMEDESSADQIWVDSQGEMVIPSSVGEPLNPVQEDVRSLRKILLAALKLHFLGESIHESSGFENKSDRKMGK
jgi:hypothetical protein